MRLCFIASSLVLLFSLPSHAAISVAGGPNSWSFLNREWAVVPTPAGGVAFLPAAPAMNSIPIVAGMELRGSFLVDAANPQTTPATTYPLGLPTNPELGGVFGGLLLDPASPFLVGGAATPFLWFNPAPATGGYLQVYSDDGSGGASDPGTSWDNDTSASGAAVSAYAGIDAAWEAATGVADGTLVYSGLFAPLTPGEIPGIGVPSGPVVFTALVTGLPSPAFSAVAFTAYLDVAADGLSAQDATIDSDVFGVILGFGRDMTVNSFAYGSDAAGTPGGPAAGPKIFNVDDGLIGASAISNDPVRFTRIVPEPASMLIWIAIAGTCVFAFGRKHRNAQA